MRVAFRRLLGLSAAALVASASPSAHAFSTRVHIMISNQIREALIAGQGKIKLRGGDGYSVQIKPDDVAALTDHPLAFRAGAIGPDNMVFPAMTDPSHAVGTRPYEQCEALYNEAVTGEERAYALGCFLHGTTDAVAHHYVNYMTGETFTLTPLTSSRQQSWTNVVRHILAESAIQERAAALKPEAFASGQLSHAIPKSFVLRTYLDDTSPVWKLMARLADEKFKAAEAKNPGASLPTLLASSGLAPAEQLAMAPVYVKRLQASREQLRAYVQSQVKAMQDPSTADGAKLGVSPGPDGKLGTKDDDTACAVSCPTLYATYFTYSSLLLPRKSASGQELPPAFDKISDKLGSDLEQFLPAYIDTVENLSSLLNQPVQPGDTGFNVSKADVNTAFSPMLGWANGLTTIDYETVVQAVAPDWLIDLQNLMQAVGINITIGNVLEALFQPVVQPIKDGIKEYVIDEAQLYLNGLIDEIKVQKADIEIEYAQRLKAAAPDGVSGTALDHFYDSGIFLHSFNIASATFGNHKIILPEGEDPVGVGPASFDASHTPSWMQAGLCGYLDKQIFPLGHDVKGMLSVKIDGKLSPAKVSDDSPVECHDGALNSFAKNPSQAVCDLVELQELIEDPSHRGTLTRAYPPFLAEKQPSCLNHLVPGLPPPPQNTGGSGGSGGGQGGSSSGGSGNPAGGSSSGGSGQGAQAGMPSAGAGGAPLATCGEGVACSADQTCLRDLKNGCFESCRCAGSAFACDKQCETPSAGSGGSSASWVCGAGEKCTPNVTPDPCIKDQKNGCFLTCKCFDGRYACDQACDSGEPGDPENPGPSGKGGQKSATGAAPSGGDDGGACGCAVPGRSAPPAPAAGLLALALGALRRRRRALAAGALLAALTGCGDDPATPSPQPVEAAGDGGSGGSSGKGGSGGKAGSGPVCGQGRKCTPGVSVDPCFKDQKNGCFLVCECVSNAYKCEEKCETPGAGAGGVSGGAGGSPQGGKGGSGNQGGSPAGGGGQPQAGGGGQPQAGTGQAGTGQAGSGTAGSGQAGTGQGGAGSGQGLEGDCCSENQAPNCTDKAIQACVCGNDSYCCETQWDGQCVEEVDTFGCGSCTGASGAGGAAGGAAGSGGEGGGGGSPQLELLSKLGESTWHGLQSRLKGNKQVSRAVQLEFSASSLQWVEIVNPYGPSRKREHRVFTVTSDGKLLKTTVDAPAGWPVPANNGQKRDFSVSITDGSPRTLTVTNPDGSTEQYEEGVYPAPTDGLTATARSFSSGPVNDAFCNSGLSGFDRKLIWDFARGKSTEPALDTDVVAGAKLFTWFDDSGKNQFSVVDVDGFDKLGGSDMSDQFNFFVTYTGRVKQPGGKLQMKELDDVVEDGLWVFLNNGVGSTNTNDVFLEVHGFAWPDLTSGLVSQSFTAGEVPIEIIIARCAKAISDVDVMISLDNGPFVTVGDAPTKPEINAQIFPPGLF